MQTHYNARILKLKAGQDALKERCSADDGMLQLIGREVGQQVRIKRTDKPEFFALYTVATANPAGDGSDVVRTGPRGRERLGTPDEIMDAVVQAKVVDDYDPSAHGARFFECAHDDPNT